jgi:HK97 family phage major capsid protein
MTPEKASELRQRRAKELDRAREIVEKAEKDNRNLTKDEDVEHRALIDSTLDLAHRISRLERMDAVEKNGPEVRDRRSEPLPHEDLANVGTRHTYSILRAARAIASKGSIPFDGLEAEVSRELEKRTNKTAQGFMMPYRTSGVPGMEKAKREYEQFRRQMEGVSGAERRNLDSVIAGGGSVPTILEKDWIELLRNRMRVKEAGAREVFDLTGKFSIPRQNAAATAYWVAEGAPPTGTNQTLDQVPFTPHTIGAFTDINRRFFELTILDSGEEFVKEDLTAIIARGIDLAALNGPGSSQQPLGILQNSAITTGRTVALGTNGGAPTWAACVELHTIVARGNASDLGEFVYIGNADVEGTLATTAKIGSTFPIFLLENDKVFNKRFLSTQQLPNTFTKGSGSNLSPMIGGIFNQLVMAYWSAVDILVDPYTGSSSGTIRIVALQDMDIQVRHNEAFSCWVDMISDQTQ